MVGSWPQALALGWEDLCQCSIETTTNTPAYFVYPIDFMEYMDKLVVIFIWRHTCLPENGRRVVQLIRRHFKLPCLEGRTTPTTIVKGVNIRVEDQVYLQATSLKGTKHFHVKGKLTPRFNNPLRGHCKTKDRWLPARVTTWVTHCAQHFPHDTAPEVFPTS